jgi:Ti-type conjugative transfer relaxase TraA
MNNRMLHSHARAHLHIATRCIVLADRSDGAPPQVVGRERGGIDLAVYHLSVKTFSRGQSASAVAKAAYRAGERLYDERSARTHDYTDKPGVISATILAPDGVPAWVYDRSRLWNEVVKAEKRIDAREAREVRVALPVELSGAEQQELITGFVKDQFVARGMVADVCIHEADEQNPHVHILLTTREIGPEGFGLKNRTWNDRAMMLEWREEWANHMNRALARAGHNVRVDHRSYKDQGVELKPMKHLGIPVAAAWRSGHSRSAKPGSHVGPQVAADHRSIVASNTKLIRARPQVALKALALSKSTFTEADIAAFLTGHVEAAEKDALLEACLADRGLVCLGRDGGGAVRFALDETIKLERRMLKDARSLSERSLHGVTERTVAKVSSKLRLGYEQELAFRHLTLGTGDLAVVEGYAGTGKSYLLGAARQAWEAQGYRVSGAAIAAKAADGLRSSAGIQSSTLASLLISWRTGRSSLTSRDVLVIDEAGMVATSTMAEVVETARRAGAKVVLVGDTRQLQAIEAGAPMRAIADRIGAATISDVRRQSAQWMREASRAMGAGNAAAGVEAYRSHGALRRHESQEEAIEAVLDDWLATQAKHPGCSQLLLAYTKRDVAALNAEARDRLKSKGGLTGGLVFEAELGAREFAAGDRLVFLKNDRRMGVRNGTLATVTAVSRRGLTVLVSEEDKAPRTVTIDPKEYRHFDHGYALTIHKSQGATVDYAHVLGSKFFDSSVSYVALSRHRHGVSFHWSAEELGDEAGLLKTMTRSHARKMAVDILGEEALGAVTFRDRIAALLSSAGYKNLIRTTDAAALQKLQGLSVDELEQRMAGLIPVAERRPPTLAGAIERDQAVVELQTEVAKLHEAYVAAAGLWDRFAKDHEPRLVEQATKGKGEGAEVYRSYRRAFDDREKAFRALHRETLAAQVTPLEQQFAKKLLRESEKARIEVARIRALLEVRVVEERKERQIGERVRQLLSTLADHEDREASRCAMLRKAMFAGDLPELGEGDRQGPSRLRTDATESIARRVESERVLKHEFGVEAPPVGDAKRPRELSPEEWFQLSQGRSVRATRAWSQWRNEARPEQILAARKGEGPGGKLFMDFRSTRAWAAEAAKELQVHRSQELQIKRGPRF